MTFEQQLLIALSGAAAGGILGAGGGFLAGLAIRRMDRNAHAAQLEKERTRTRRIEELDGTRAAFRIRLMRWGSMLDRDEAAVRLLTTELAEHVDRERLRYYGHRDLIVEHWDVDERIERWYFDEEHRTVADPALATAVGNHRIKVEEAFREARELIDRDKAVGEHLLNDPELEAARVASRDRSTRRLQLMNARDRARSGEPSA